MLRKSLQHLNGFQYILCYGSTQPVHFGNCHPAAFQYILCYGSTCLPASISHLLHYFNTSYVTVQQWCNNSSSIINFISIHPMLRFNPSYSQFLAFAGEISIHPMLRFNGNTLVSSDSVSTFQYILCYGSTNSVALFGLFILKFQYILCYGSTIVNLNDFKQCPEFQYILCYGSTNLKPCFSNKSLTISIHPMLRFNTAWRKTDSFGCSISIHPMLRFNLESNKSSPPLYNFNTSYVTVQHAYDLYQFYQNKFQYILCYGSTLIRFFALKFCIISIHPMLWFNEKVFT